MARARNRTRLAVGMLCALALLFLGLSHKMPALSAPADVLAFAAYQLPDGTAPELCTPSDQGKMKFSSPACDACRLAGSVILPTPPCISAYPVLQMTPDFPLPVQAAIVAAIDRAQTARGPPFVLLS